MGSKKHSDALDLCFAVYFKNPSAYNVLRQSGFVVPCARTLKREIQMCVRKVRANVLSDVERHVTIALEGM